ncbi:MAG: cation transporter [Thermodesulfobacteriota bacterium]|jgi:divalent metal cation (Fe/Co/Zn/Cd) transporter
MKVDAVNQGIHYATLRRGRWLEFFTIGWNLLEAAVGIGAGLFAGSIALLGFGIDSLIETSSGAILLWRLQEGAEGEKRERRALKLVGFSFLALAVYVAFEALKALLTRESPEKSIVGIALAALSLVVMPLLAIAKRRVAAKLSSRAMRADSRQTDICAYLSAILLAGLGLNVLFGWWWADPVAALGMLPIILKEGIEALRGDTCEDCHPTHPIPLPRDGGEEKGEGFN